MLNTNCVGKKYKVSGISIELGDLEKMASALGDAVNAITPDGELPEYMAALYALRPSAEAVFSDSELGIDMLHLVHGEQEFEFFSPVYLHDLLTVETEIEEIYSKRSLEFLITRATVYKGSTAVCTCRSTFVIRSAQ